MKNGKYLNTRSAKHSTKKMLALVLALVLTIGGVVGGTIAWLTDKTEEVQNTFTASDIDITLTEVKGVADGKWEKQMIPGVAYDKDPTVAVVDATTNIDIYLFVKFVENEAAKTYLTYTSTLTAANGWTQGDGTNIPYDVWYRVVEDTAETQSWELLEGNKVTVKDTVTKETMEEAAAASLTYTAYAIQYQGFETDPAGAWAKIS